MKEQPQQPEVFGSGEACVCPACHQLSLPRIRGTANAACCNNPACMVIVNRAGEIEGVYPRVTA